MRVPRPLVIAALCAAALALAVPTAEAKVPPAFFGTVWDGEVRGAPQAAQDAQWRLMAATGVGSVRTSFDWNDAQPTEGAPFDLTKSDALVRLSAANGLTLLPVVQ